VNGIEGSVLRKIKRKNGNKSKTRTRFLYNLSMQSTKNNLNNDTKKQEFSTKTELSC